ncbi:snake venom metalloproteinase kistomin-like [Dermacentor albipictus]|uniref:snake venom metalloproteinase kistomin-like n=1 Tax=Dermacentor albipictus TaxID=60249 RepID=UPI0038FC5C44
MAQRLQRRPEHHDDDVDNIDDGKVTAVYVSTLCVGDATKLDAHADLAKLGNETLDKRVAGLAYVGTVCTHSAVAEGEDIAKSYAGVHAMAHELAHSLGAKHDPQDNSECSWSKGFLMSYEDKGSTKFRLSTCSQQNITNVVQHVKGEYVPKRRLRKHCKTSPVWPE